MPKTRFMDVVKEDMWEAGVTEEDSKQSEMETNDLLWPLQGPDKE